MLWVLISYTVQKVIVLIYILVYVFYFLLSAGHIMFYQCKNKRCCKSSNQCFTIIINANI